MKAKNLLLTVALLVAGGYVGDLLAQTNLNALMKKCETMDKVRVEVIYNKDKKTKKIEKEVVTVSFSSKEHPELLDQFVKAFQQDREAAYKIIETTENGKVMPSFYRFSVGDKDISYSLENMESKYEGNPYMLRNGDIEVTKIERFAQEE